jgi:hypothetical protein
MAKKEEEKFEISSINEEYLKIYHEYFVLKWDWASICRYNNCSKSKVSKALKWVIQNRLEVPSKHLIKGAIDAITARIEINQELYSKESKKTRYRDNQFIISLSKEIREDEKTLYKLQEIYDEKETDSEHALSAGQVLQLIKAAGEKKEHPKEE